MSKFTKAQLALIAAAANRRDHLLAPPQGTTDRPLAALRTRLINLGLVTRVRVKARQPAWTTDDDGVRFGLVLTEAGLDGARPAGDAEQEGAVEDRPPRAPACDDPGSESHATSADSETASAGSEAATAPRDGTKQALILGLLRRPAGASLDELVAATGWLPHTTRAALTGLRQRGFGVYRHKAPDGRSVYLVPNPREAPASKAA